MLDDAQARCGSVIVSKLDGLVEKQIGRSSHAEQQAPVARVQLPAAIHDGARERLGVGVSREADGVSESQMVFCQDGIREQQLEGQREMRDMAVIIRKAPRFHQRIALETIRDHRVEVGLDAEPERKLGDRGVDAVGVVELEDWLDRRHEARVRENAQRQHVVVEIREFGRMGIGGAETGPQEKTTVVVLHQHRLAGDDGVGEDPDALTRLAEQKLQLKLWRHDRQRPTRLMYNHSDCRFVIR